MNTTTDYNKQATDFLNKTGATIEIKYLKTGKHFEDDKEERDIYEITIFRQGRKYTFNFGNSINASGQYIFKNPILGRNTLKKDRYFLTTNEYKIHRFMGDRDIIKNPNYSAPSEYDILTCLTKYEPGTFENFCSDYGYDTDSKRAEKTYNAVREEYLQLSRLFNEQELTEMQEIQ